MNGFASLLKELRIITHHKILLIVICIIAIMPCIYAGPFISSYWDPYAKVKDLPMILVNHDNGTTTTDGEKVNIGSKLANKLKKSKDLDISVVTESQAKEKLKNNKVYLMIKIPADFSKDAMSAFENDKQKAKLIITPNEGYNFTGATISSSAAKEVKENLSHEITKNYVTAILEAQTKLGNGLNKLSNGGGKLNDGVASAKEGSTKLQNGAEKLANGTMQFNQGMTSLYNGTKPVGDGANKLASGLNSLDQGIGQLLTGAQQLEKGMQTSSDKSVELKNGMSQVLDGTSKLTDLSSQITNDSQSNTSQLTQKFGQLYATSQNIASTNSSMNQKVDALEEKINTNNSLPSAEKQELLTQINDLASLVSQESDQTNTSIQTLGQTKEFIQQANVIAYKQNILSGGLTKIKAGEQKLADGTSQFADGQQKLLSGVKGLTNGINSLNNGSNQLVTGSQKLSNGINQLSSGTKKLYDASSELTNGSHDLAQGASTLTNGMNELNKGSSDLANGLHIADEKVNGEALNIKNIAKIVSDPVGLHKVPFNHLAKYGPAFAPYFLSLGLYVGIFLFCSSFPLLQITPGQTAGSWFLGKMGVLMIIGLCQALLVDALILLMPIHVENIASFILFTIISSWAFGAVLLFLNTTFDKIGRFITMGLLILQLTSSGGSFPLEMQGSFFRYIHPFMPMSYTVQGFKSILTMNDSPSSFMWGSIVSLLVFFVIGAVLSLLYYIFRFNKYHKNETSGNTTTSAA